MYIQLVPNGSGGWFVYKKGKPASEALNMAALTESLTQPLTSRYISVCFGQESLWLATRGFSRNRNDAASVHPVWLSEHLPQIAEEYLAHHRVTPPHVKILRVLPGSWVVTVDSHLVVESLRTVKRTTATLYSPTGLQNLFKQRDLVNGAEAVTVSFGDPEMWLSASGSLRLDAAACTTVTLEHLSCLVGPLTADFEANRRRIDCCRWTRALAFYADPQNWVGLRLEPEYVKASLTGSKISGIRFGWTVAERALNSDSDL